MACAVWLPSMITIGPNETPHTCCPFPCTYRVLRRSFHPSRVLVYLLHYGPVKEVSDVEASSQFSSRVFYYGCCLCRLRVVAGCHRTTLVCSCHAVTCEHLRPAGGILIFNQDAGVLPPPVSSKLPEVRISASLYSPIQQEDAIF